MTNRITPRPWFGLIDWPSIFYFNEREYREYLCGWVNSTSERQAAQVAQQRLASGLTATLRPMVGNYS